MDGSCGQPTKGGPPALRMSMGLTLIKISLLQRVLDLNIFLDEAPKVRKLDMIFGMWNMRSLLRTS
jgi:riboflavin synthase